jgi:hypothetical protein
MNEFDESRVEPIDENEPAVQRQRRPWHAPKLIKPSSVKSLTGTHHKSSGGDVSASNWSIS